MLLGATSRMGVARSGDRNQAGGLSEADGQQKQFVLPDDEAPADNAVAPEASVGQSQTNRSDTRTRSGDRTRSRDPLDAGRDDQAVNPLAAASQPEPAQGAVVTVSQGTVNLADALKIAGAAQQTGRGANGLTNIAAWWQSAQGANQPATGRVQAMNRPAEGMAATWLQGQDNARAAAGESQQAANQVPAAMAPGANTTGGQPADKDLGPRTSRMLALADATVTAGAATATTGAATASPAARTVPGAANEVVPAGAEAKPTSPNVLPTAAAWLQGQDNVRAVTGEPQQAANQVPAAMAPDAKTTGGQPAGKDLDPRTSRMPAPADATAAAGAATATTGSAATASGASGTVPGAATAAAGAANEVVPAGAEAKPTSPNVLPTAAAGETAQTEPAGQA